MGPRGMRHPAEYSTAGGGGGNGSMPLPVVFTGNPPRVYGTLPVVSTILSDGHNTTGTLMARPCFQQRTPRNHPQANMTPPSPDYQSLDQLAARPVWQTGGVDMFTSTLRNNRPINNLPSSTSASSYGCLIDPPRRNNYYEVSSNSSTNHGPRQKSATLGRLLTMTEETDTEDSGGPIGSGGCSSGKRRQGMLGAVNHATTRSYSQLQATTGMEESGGERDRPTRYTYQAIREASFV